jgi:hypothetical protein
MSGRRTFVFSSMMMMVMMIVVVMMSPLVLMIGVVLMLVVAILSLGLRPMQWNKLRLYLGADVLLIVMIMSS